jgi:hypothetical protein
VGSTNRVVINLHGREGYVAQFWVRTNLSHNVFDKITIVFGLRVDKCIGFVVETDTDSITCDGASCGGSHFDL